ncbi:MAG: mechanosensitive ion channel [Burkholderiales bacterium]|nr:mechanosensitive ion channel [Burkholderiales bacterium]
MNFLGPTALVQTMSINSSLSGKDLLDELSIYVTTLLRQWMGQLFGVDVSTPVVGSVTWVDLGLMLCLMLVVLFLNLVAFAFVRHKLKRFTGKPEDKKLQHHVFGAIDKPLYVVIWIYGIYFAATPLLMKLGPSEGLHIVREVFSKVFDLGVFAVLFWLFFRFTHVLDAQLAVWTTNSSSKLDGLFVPLLGKSLRTFVPVIGVIFALPILGLPTEYASVLSKGTSILLIIAVAIILFQAVIVMEKAVLEKYDINAVDNLQARKIYTQIHVISKLLYAVITIFTVASILMLFQEVRQFGTSILASAGVVGIVVGFAAQKTISNLFAGFQLAMTQPIRLDDVVIVEGEWGRVEEITLTYVVIHIWDDRRLVVPLSYFIEKPFQNWTRVSAQLLGSVVVWVDYTTPLDELRTALKTIIESNPLWDKRFWNLQVTDTTEKSMKIRVLATSADSSTGWDLRCDIREKLIAYIQKHHPLSLPTFRTQIGGERPELLSNT